MGRLCFMKAVQNRWPALLAVFLVALFATAAQAEVEERRPPFTLRSNTGYAGVLDIFNTKGLRDFFGSSIAIKDPQGRTIYRDCDSLAVELIVDAAWNPAGDSLIIVTRNGGGHSPWRHFVYVFPVAQRHLYRILAPPSWAFLGGKIAFLAHNRVRLIAGPYGKLQCDAMDHPKGLVYSISLSDVVGGPSRRDERN
jgi:hypothetical protein